MSRRVGQRLSDTRGFTLVEVLMAMTLGLVILFAALTAFEAFARGTATSASLTDAEDSGRRVVASMERILRDAGTPPLADGTTPTTVTRAIANDIVFLSTAWPNESHTASATHVERLCLDTTSKTIWFDGLHAGTTGPADPGPACPSQATGWTHSVIARKIANSAALPLFHFASTTPVRSVGIELWTDSGTSARSHTLSLGSGSALRGALGPAVTAADITVTCNYGGDGKPLLSVPAAAGLTLAATSALIVGPTKLLLAAAGAQTVNLSITDARGLTTLLSKQVNC